eukprot:9965413-Alexandrium_andersonii.AAC.1
MPNATLPSHDHRLTPTTNNSHPPPSWPLLRLRCGRQRADVAHRVNAPTPTSPTAPNATPPYIPLSAH